MEYGILSYMVFVFSVYRFSNQSSAPLSPVNVEGSIEPVRPFGQFECFVYEKNEFSCA